MNAEVVIEKKRKSPPSGAGGAKNARRFTAAEKLKAVRLHLEDGFTVALVCEEIGVSKASLVLWLWPYRKHGEVGLQRPDAGKRAPKLSAPITDKIAISNRKTRQIIFGTFLTVVEGRRRS